MKRRPRPPGLAGSRAIYKLCIRQPATITNCDCRGREMAHRNQSGAGARIVSRSVGTASLLKEAAPVLLDGILPLIGQHYIGRRDPAHSVTPRQQRYLADRGASTKLDHSAFLILERSDRVPYIRLPHGGPRVRIHLPPAESQRTFEMSGPVTSVRYSLAAELPRPPFELAHPGLTPAGIP